MFLIIPFLFTGTLISSFTVFCGAKTKISKRRNAFLLNLLAAFLQMVTFLVIVGWIWSILWGMNFVQIACKYEMYILQKTTIDFSVSTNFVFVRLFI